MSSALEGFCFSQSVSDSLITSEIRDTLIAVPTTKAVLALIKRDSFGERLICLIVITGNSEDSDSAGESLIRDDLDSVPDRENNSLCIREEVVEFFIHLIEICSEREVRLKIIFRERDSDIVMYAVKGEETGLDLL